MNLLKSYITYGFAILLLIGVGVMFYDVVIEAKAPATVQEPFGYALWNSWSFTIIIISVIIFAGGMCILVLLGGEWRWE